MKKRLFAGIFAAAVLAALTTIPAEASCKDNQTCITAKAVAAKPQIVKRKHAAAHRTRKVAHRKTHRTATLVAAVAHHPGPAAGGEVVSLIKSMAPSYGVPTWFALRIAKVESNYNPSLRGKAGEYGVFQLKCATAKGIGFSGDCSALLDPAVNVRWGLKHLSLAVSMSRGNLRLAASMHNGGLGRKTEIRSYVAKVF